MRNVALLWTPLCRVQLGRLPRRPPIPRSVARRLLVAVALIGLLGVAASACAGDGGERAVRGLVLAREVASAAGDRLASVPDDGCAPDSLLPPAPMLGDDGLGVPDFRLINPDCDGR